VISRLRVALTIAALAWAIDASATPAQDVQLGTSQRSTSHQQARESFDRAAAGDDALAAAEALYQLADMDEDDMAFAAALDHYRASIARAPQSRYAPRAETRIDYLRRHSEGDFAPLKRLESVRRDAHFADAPTIDALAKDADAFPPGRVRIESWLVVGDAYQRRLNRPDDALTAYRKILADADGDPLNKQQAAHDAVDILSARGDYAGALDAASVVEAYDGALTIQVRRLARRAKLRLGSKVTLGALLVGTVAAVAMGLRLTRQATPDLTRFARLALAFALYVGVAGGLLASGYEGGSVRPFVALGGAIFLVACLARAWALFGSKAPAARVVRAIVCGASVVAAAFLLLDRIDPAYLDSFGL
jgi:tetratricopeptide (TPR) repeat protein